MTCKTGCGGMARPHRFGGGSVGQTRQRADRSQQANGRSSRWPAPPKTQANAAIVWLALIYCCLAIPPASSLQMYQQQQQQQQSPQQAASNLQPQQDYASRQHRRERVTWCATSHLERRKCLDWARAVEEANVQLEGQEPFKLNLDCALGADKDQCMAMIDDERADMILLDPGEIGEAGRYYSLTPIMTERYGPNRNEMGHYSVAVVRKRTAGSLQSLGDLFGRRACFSGVSHMASWTLPLASLIDLPRFEIADCNNLVKSTSYFFGNSCAPNALINKFNPTGDNPQRITHLCERQNQRVGAHYEPYNGAFSALKCLADPIILSSSSLGNLGIIVNPSAFNNLGGGSAAAAAAAAAGAAPADVAFLPHNTVFLADKLNLGREQRLEVPPRNELELLCPQGGRAPLDRWDKCHFGFVPAHAVIVSSRTTPERRERIQSFLRASVQLFGSPLSMSPGLGVTTSSQMIAGSGAGGTSSTNIGFRGEQEDSHTRQQQQQQQPQTQVPRPSLTNFQDLGSAQEPAGGFFRTSQPVASPNPPGSPFLLPQSPLDSLAGLPTSVKLQTNFKLTGEYSFYNYPSLDVLFSSDMTDLVPLQGVSQTFKGYLNSFPVVPATTSGASSASSPSSSQQGGGGGGGFQDYLSYFNTFYGSSSSSRTGGSLASSFEARSQTDYFEKLRRCSVPAAVLCVTSDKEFNKCLAMSKAFHAANLKPELHCKFAQSTLACMQLIRNRDADLVALDAADIYLAGLKFHLVPIVAEQIDLDEAHHYSVAVAKKSDQTTDLYSLKGKNTCHSGFLKGAGWVVPLDFLLSNDRLRREDEYKCDSPRSAAEHFDKSCAPGILSTISNTQNISAWAIRNMCELCHGTGGSYCARDASEPFFGDTGALRCLVEGGGQVAFIKHTAIFENTGGSNRETWARNLIKSDFELLCRDGSRAPVNEYKTCNLGTVPPSAIVTRGDTPLRLVDAYVNLFMYGQQYYGSKYSEEYTFKMFASSGGHDLIFQDATQQLVRVPIVNQTYKSFLGHNFLRAMETVFCA